MNDNLREQRIRALHEHIDGLEAELATARAVTNRYSHGWSPMYGPDNGAFWAHAIYAEVPMSEAERAWLASVVSPPASGDDG